MGSAGRTSRQRLEAQFGVERNQRGTMNRQFNFQNPPKWIRRLAVMVMASLPAFVAGCLIAIWLHQFWGCVVATVLLSVTAAAYWER